MIVTLWYTAYFKVYLWLLPLFTSAQYILHNHCVHTGHTHAHTPSCTNTCSLNENLQWRISQISLVKSFTGPVTESYNNKINSNPLVFPHRHSHLGALGFIDLCMKKKKRLANPNVLLLVLKDRKGGVSWGAAGFT